MARYRLYFLDSAGRFDGVVELACRTDAEAQDQVAAHADGRSMELWDRGRCVAVYPAGSGHKPD